jgi:hypothetical protein
MELRGVKRKAGDILCSHVGGFCLLHGSLNVK